jgi:hypothetical protein
MKKLFLSSLVFAMVVFSTISCSKSSVKTEKTNILLEYIKGTQLTDIFINSGDYEFGVVVEMLKAGSITQLCVKMPDDDTYRVTLWKLGEDTSVIAQVNIPVDSGEYKCLSISAVDVSEGDVYAITVNSDDWYEYSLLEGAEIPLYPRIIGNVQVLKYGYRAGAAQAFPNFFPTTYYAGIADFVFETIVEE